MGKVKRMLLDLEEDQLDLFDPELRANRCSNCGGTTSYAEWEAYYQDETIVRKVNICDYCSLVEDVWGGINEDKEK